MDLRSTQLKDTYGNLLTIGTSAGSPTTGTIENGDGQDITALDVNGSITTNGLTIDQTSNVVLDLNTTNSNGDITLNNVSYGVRLRTNNAGGFSIMPSDTTFLNVALNGDVNFYDSTGTNPDFYWDASAGGLAIGGGGSGIEGLLDLQKNDATVYTSSSRGNGYLQITNTSTASGVFSGIELIATGTGSAGAAEILCIDTGSGSGDLAFSTRNGGTWAEKVRIDSSGNVGIGTDSPSAKLDVLGQAEISDGTSTFRIANAGGSTFVGTTGAHPLFIRTDNSTAMLIDSSGNVGIGTTSPDDPLTVISNAHIYSEVTDSYLRLSVGNTLASPTQSFVLRIDNSDSDKFQIRDTTNSESRLTIDTSGNVGIGTTSPGALLNVNKATIGEYLHVGSGGLRELRFSSFDTASPHGGHDINASSGNGVLTLSTGGSEAMRIDSSGNVGIGTDSPGTLLELKESSSGAGDAVIRLRGHGNNADNTVLGALEFFNADSSGDSPSVVARVEAQSGNANGHMGELVFKTHDGSEGGEGSSPVERLRIDRWGFVGIGVTDITKHLEVSSSSNPTISIANKDTSLVADQTIGTLDFASNNETSLLNAYHSFASISAISESSVTGTSGVDGALIFSTSLNDTQTEKMRIDSSGNVLVGTTDSTLYDNSTGGGFKAGGDNRTDMAREGDLVATMNRTGNSDGDILQFRKDGSVVGSIGTKAGDLTIGDADVGIRFDTGTGLVPWNLSTNLATDNAIDIGASSARFKDLYLSGSVYLGGTDSANALDDYEEGTWTPTLTPATSGTITLNTASDTFQYTKIGRQVTLTGLCSNMTISSPVGDTIELGGLPFAIGDYAELGGRFVASVYINESDVTADIRTGLKAALGTEGGTTLTIYMDASTLSNNQSDLSLSITYFT